jgi:dihydrofolate reductase
MAKFLWHNTMSLDGFVTGPDNDMTWVRRHYGPNAVVQRVLPEIGAILLGARSYEGARTDGGQPYGGAISVPQFVLTHQAPELAAAGFSFVHGDLDLVAETDGAAAGARYVAVLGQQVGRQLLHNGSLDEILIHLAPVLLGGGQRMFAGTGNPMDLERITAHASATVTDLWFKVNR